MREPIQIGGHWTCDKCGESYHSSIVHECGARQRYIEATMAEIAKSMDAPTDAVQPLTAAELPTEKVMAKLVRDHEIECDKYGRGESDTHILKTGAALHGAICTLIDAARASIEDRERRLPSLNVEAAARVLWQMGNERVGFREWENVSEHYLAEAQAALNAARGCTCKKGESCSDCDPEGHAYPPTTEKATWLD